MKAATSPPHLGTLILLTALTVLSLNMFLPALPAMAREFGTTQSVMGLAVSGYMIAAAVLQLGIGPASDRIGRRPVMLAAIGLFALASAGCLLASDLGLFLVCRMAQSAVVAGVVLSSAVIRDLHPPSIAAGKMGTVAAAMGIAPMLGPTLGGVLETAVSWRAIFGLYTGLGLVALLLVWVDLGETHFAPPRPLAAQVRSYGALLAAWPFWAFALCTMFSVGTFYVFLAGAPFVAVRSFGLSSAVLGAGLGSITFGYMLGSVVTARLAPRLGLAAMILGGRLVALGGLSAGAVAFLAGVWHPLVLFAATLCVGLGNGLSLASTNAGAMSVRPGLSGSAAGLSGALQLLGGAGLSTLTLVWLQDAVSPLRLLALMVACSGLALVFGVLAIRGAARLPDAPPPGTPQP